MEKEKLSIYIVKAIGLTPATQVEWWPFQGEASVRVLATSPRKAVETVEKYLHGEKLEYLLGDQVVGARAVDVSFEGDVDMVERGLVGPVVED